MRTIEIEILDTIEKYGIWIIILLVAILIFVIGIYTIMCRLEKSEKQKRQDIKELMSILYRIENNTKNQNMKK